MAEAARLFRRFAQRADEVGINTESLERGEVGIASVDLAAGPGRTF